MAAVAAFDETTAPAEATPPLSVLDSIRETDHAPLLLSMCSLLDVAQLGAVSKSWRSRTEQHFASKPRSNGGAFPCRETTLPKLSRFLDAKAGALEHVRWRVLPKSLANGSPAGPTEGAAGGSFAAGDVAVRCGGWSLSDGGPGVHNIVQWLDFNRPAGAVEAALRRLARVRAAAMYGERGCRLGMRPAAWLRHNLHGCTEVELSGGADELLRDTSPAATGCAPHLPPGARWETASLSSEQVRPILEASTRRALAALVAAGGLPNHMPGGSLGGHHGAAGVSVTLPTAWLQRGWRPLDATDAPSPPRAAAPKGAAAAAGAGGPATEGEAVGAAGAGQHAEEPAAARLRARSLSVAAVEGAVAMRRRGSSSGCFADPLAGAAGADHAVEEEEQSLPPLLRKQQAHPRTPTPFTLESVCAAIIAAQLPRVTFGGQAAPAAAATAAVGWSSSASAQPSRAASALAAALPLAYETRPGHPSAHRVARALMLQPPPAVGMLAQQPVQRCATAAAAATAAGDDAAAAAAAGDGDGGASSSPASLPPHGGSSGSGGAYTAVTAAAAGGVCDRHGRFRYSMVPQLQALVARAAQAMRTPSSPAALAAARLAAAEAAAAAAGSAAAGGSGGEGGDDDEGDEVDVIFVDSYEPLELPPPPPPAASSFGEEGGGGGVSAQGSRRGGGFNAAAAAAAAAARGGRHGGTAGSTAAAATAAAEAAGAAAAAATTTTVPGGLLVRLQSPASTALAHLTRVRRAAASSGSSRPEDAPLQVTAMRRADCAGAARGGGARAAAAAAAATWFAGSLHELPAPPLTEALVLVGGAHMPGYTAVSGDVYVLEARVKTVAVRDRRLPAACVARDPRLASAASDAEEEEPGSQVEESAGCPSRAHAAAAAAVAAGGDGLLDLLVPAEAWEEGAGAGAGVGPDPAEDVTTAAGPEAAARYVSRLEARAAALRLCCLVASSTAAPARRGAGAGVGDGGLIAGAAPLAKRRAVLPAGVGAAADTAAVAVAGGGGGCGGGGGRERSRGSSGGPRKWVRALLQQQQQPAPADELEAERLAERLAAVLDAEWTIERRLQCRWHRIRTRGLHALTPRAYHAAALAHVSPGATATATASGAAVVTGAAAGAPRCAVYVSGGIGASGESIWALESVDLATWAVARVPTAGAEPSARHGHSMTPLGGALWVFSGADGGDILNGGKEMRDLHCLDLRTHAWSQPRLFPPLPPPPPPASTAGAANPLWRHLQPAPLKPPQRQLLPVEDQARALPDWVGRLHSATALGERILIFGGHGGIRRSRRMCVIHPAARAVYEPGSAGAGGASTMQVTTEGGNAGAVSVRRYNHTAHLCGSHLLLFGGWRHSPIEAPALLDLCPVAVPYAPHLAAAAQQQQQQRVGPLHAPFAPPRRSSSSTAAAASAGASVSGAVAAGDEAMLLAAAEDDGTSSTARGRAAAPALGVKRRRATTATTAAPAAAAEAEVARGGQPQPPSAAAVPRPRSLLPTFPRSSRRRRADPAVDAATATAAAATEAAESGAEAREDYSPLPRGFEGDARVDYSRDSGALQEAGDAFGALMGGMLGGIGGGGMGGGMGGGGVLGAMGHAMAGAMGHAMAGVLNVVEQMVVGDEAAGGGGRAADDDDGGGPMAPGGGGLPMPFPFPFPPGLLLPFGGAEGEDRRAGHTRHHAHVVHHRHGDGGGGEGGDDNLDAAGDDAAGYGDNLDAAGDGNGDDTAGDDAGGVGGGGFAAAIHRQMRQAVRELLQGGGGGAAPGAAGDGNTGDVQQQQQPEPRGTGGGPGSGTMLGFGVRMQTLHGGPGGGPGDAVDIFMGGRPGGPGGGAMQAAGGPGGAAAAAAAADDGSGHMFLPLFSLPLLAHNTTRGRRGSAGRRGGGRSGVAHTAAAAADASGSTAASSSGGDRASASSASSGVTELSAAGRGRGGDRGDRGGRGGRGGGGRAGGDAADGEGGGGPPGCPLM